MLISNGHRIVEVDGLTFTVRPETYMDHARAIDLMTQRLKDFSEPVRFYVLEGLCVMQRIVAWEGPVLPNGGPAPCDDEHKDLLFGAHPQLLRSLIERIAEAEDADKKKSSPSQNGSQAAPSTKRLATGAASPPA